MIPYKVTRLSRLVQITCEWFLYLKEQQITISAPQFQALFSPDTDLEFASLPLINTA